MLQRSKILNLIGIAAIIYLSVIVFQTVKHNYNLDHQIALQQKRIDDLTANEIQLKYDVQYYRTNSFIEKSARQNLGLIQPGEGVIVLPKTTTPPIQSTSTTKNTAKPKSNFSQWWSFLFG